MKQRSRILEEPAAQPAVSGLDTTKLVPLRRELRELDKEIKRLREEHQVKLNTMLEARDLLTRKISALEA